MGTGGKKEGLPRTGNFYVHIPSKTDPSAVTDPGTHSVMVLFPVANMSELTWASSSLDATSNYDYNDLSTWCRSVILSRLKSSGYGKPFDGSFLADEAFLNQAFPSIH